MTSNKAINIVVKSKENTAEHIKKSALFLTSIAKLFPKLIYILELANLH